MTERKTTKSTTKKTKTASKSTAKNTSSKAPASNQTENLDIKPYEAGKDEEYMSDAQLEHFESVLKTWKAQLQGDAEETKTYIQDESTSLSDINDRATQEEEFALALRTRDRERKLIRKIDKSLADIASGDYGFCQTCGVEIGLRRLEARPTATQCIDCKTLSEMKEKQTWGHA